MSMIKISIVIPFYNVEKYIAACLDSVYNQDIPEEEYEVICVNDASPDGSRDIVLEYQKKHSNLVLIEHEVNKKLGAARNTGRRIARGKYLWNVDSDDMIAPNCLGEILEKCEKNDLDVLLFCYDILVGREITVRPRPWLEESPCTGFTFWEQQVIYHQSEISQVWTQVYKKGYLDKEGIYSPEVNMSEDEPYTYLSILLAEKIMAIQRSFYLLRKNNSSITHFFKYYPTPELLYEGSFNSGKNLFSIITAVPRRKVIIRDSIRNVIRFIITSSRASYDILSPDDKKHYQRLCRKNFFRNGYVLSVLNKNQVSRYIKFLIRG